MSSGAGAILLKDLDDRLGLTARLATSLGDQRKAGKLEHDLPPSSAGAASGSPAATPIPTMPPGTRTTPTTGYWWGEIR